MSVSQILSSLGVPDGAASDGAVHTRINLHNVTQLRDLLDIGLSPEQRAQHADALLDGLTAPADQPGVALLHRLIRHVVGNEELSQEDRDQLAPALPITAHVTTQPPAGGTGKSTGGPGGGTGKSTGGPGGGTGLPPVGPPMQVNTVWDVSTPDGSLKVINLPNGIELLDGGCIVARSTPLHFTCSSLTRMGGPPAGYSGDFNILGTTGAPAATPPAPLAPGQAPAGVPGQCSSAGIAGQSGGPGAPGQQGTAGAAGLRGNDGIASALASIAITHRLEVAKAAKKVLVVATQSGPGGPGGDGGPGGEGQQGGNGGKARPAIVRAMEAAPPGPAAGEGQAAGPATAGMAWTPPATSPCSCPLGPARAWSSRRLPRPRRGSPAVLAPAVPAGRPASLARRASTTSAGRSPGQAPSATRAVLVTPAPIPEWPRRSP